MKKINLSEIISEAGKALAEAQNALDDPKGLGSLLSFTNYEYNIGRYFTLVELIDDRESYLKLYADHKKTLDEVTRRADKLYRSLKIQIYN